MKFKIIFKDGREESVTADNHEETEKYHIFYRESDAPFNGRFVVSEIVKEVQDSQELPPSTWTPYRI